MSYDPRYPPQGQPPQVALEPVNQWANQPGMTQTPPPANPGPYGAPQRTGGATRTPVGGFRAEQWGLEPNKFIEYLIADVRTAKGGTFKTIEFYKPYISAAGEQKKSFSFPFPNGLRELIERINHAQMTYAAEKGIYVFQPHGMVLQPVQQQQAPAYGQPPRGNQGGFNY